MPSNPYLPRLPCEGVATRSFLAHVGDVHERPTNHSAMRIDSRGSSSADAAPDAVRSPAAASVPATPRWRMWPWLAAGALSVGNLFLHKPISDICDATYARIGR